MPLGRENYDMQQSNRGRGLSVQGTGLQSSQDIEGSLGEDEQISSGRTKSFDSSELDANRSEHTSTYERRNRSIWEQVDDAVREHPAVLCGAAAAIGLAASTLALSDKSRRRSAKRKLSRLLNSASARLAVTKPTYRERAAGKIADGYEDARDSVESGLHEAGDGARQLMSSAYDFGKEAEESILDALHSASEKARRQPIATTAVATGVALAAAYFFLPEKTRKALNPTSSGTSNSGRDWRVAAGRKGGRASSYEERTYAELYERAQEMEIDGRSNMNKSELIEALRAQ